MAYYVKKHHGLYPWDIIDNVRDTNDRNSTICDDCYKEITKDNTAG